MLRLLYLCVHPRNSSPSQRYRFEQFESYLAAQGVQVEYAHALSRADLPVFYGATPAAAKALVAAKALARRAWSLRPRVGRDRYDVVLVAREAFFLFGAWPEWTAQLQAPLVFDFDDAVFTLGGVSAANARFKFLKNVDKVSKIVSMATAVVAGNDYLASWAQNHNRAVHVIPTCVDTDRYTPPTQPDSSDVLTIGWCGSPSTVAHLRLILPVLERVKRKFGSAVQVRMMGDPKFSYEPLGLHGEAWSSTAEIPFLQSMDIGLMPLPDDEWSKGKCGLKALTSMACGAATVLSPVGVNERIAQHGTSALLASTQDEWFNALSALVEDSALRRRIGAAGRDRVVNDYSVSRWRAPLSDILFDAARARR